MPFFFMAVSHVRVVSSPCVFRIAVTKDWNDALLGAHATFPRKRASVRSKTLLGSVSGFTCSVAYASVRATSAGGDPLAARVTKQRGEIGTQTGGQVGEEARLLDTAPKAPASWAQKTSRRYRGYLPRAA